MCAHWTSLCSLFNSESFFNHNTKLYIETLPVVIIGRSKKKKKRNIGQLSCYTLFLYLTIIIVVIIDCLSFIIVFIVFIIVVVIVFTCILP